MFYQYFILVPSFVPRSNSFGARSQQLSSPSSGSSRRNDIKMMPIGVPKVAYRIPGSQSADWYVKSVVKGSNRGHIYRYGLIARLARVFGRHTQGRHL